MKVKRNGINENVSMKKPMKWRRRSNNVNISNESSEENNDVIMTIMKKMTIFRSISMKAKEGENENK